MIEKKKNKKSHFLKYAAFFLKTLAFAGAAWRQVYLRKPALMRVSDLLVPLGLLRSQHGGLGWDQLPREVCSSGQLREQIGELHILAFTAAIPVVFFKAN